MKVKYVKCRSEAILPEYQTKGSAGADLHVCLPGMGDAIPPGETKVFNTGLCVEIPYGYELQIRSRSGLASKGIVVTNSPGTIDCDYRGELQVILTNLGKTTKELFHGDRIAQIVLAKVERIEWSTETELKLTKRGKLGFGSTGV